VIIVTPHLTTPVKNVADLPNPLHDSAEASAIDVILDGKSVNRTPPNPDGELNPSPPLPPAAAAPSTTPPQASTPPPAPVASADTSSAPL